MCLCADDERAYGYVSFDTGDEMSRRRKFAFITWIGEHVRPLQKARVSTDKAFVKKICYVSHMQVHMYILYTRHYRSQLGAWWGRPERMLVTLACGLALECSCHYAVMIITRLPSMQ